MSPASYLTAPPRVATGSIPPGGRAFLGCAGVFARRFVRRARSRRAPRMAALARVHLVRSRNRRGPRPAGGGRRPARGARGELDRAGRRAERPRSSGSACRNGACGSCGPRPAKSPTRSARRSCSRRRMTRVGAIDLGTNSTRLLVADVDDGRIDEVGRGALDHPARRGVDARRRLLPQPSPAFATSSPTTAASSSGSAPSTRSLWRRVPSATPRTARRSSARSSGATASRPAS